MKKTIDSFKGEYRWLSNFHLAEVEFEGIKYPSTEHAYQAAKSDSKEIREEISKLEKPNQAKKAGKLFTVLPPDWHTSRKFEVMEAVLREKFFKHPDLRTKLLETGAVELIEGNTWHDNEWGSCICEKCNNTGKNNLGKLLMKIREELK